ncbi:porin [Crenobacter caeni]|uniref:Porin n=1 Tax=Crenobacter caeni TaxID=2705474 RepID=A0A6B2KRW6_9NEIS|nr:porin [Crenobacter caeni]NDV12874.1 porin [Crenobacter caeni]
MYKHTLAAALAAIFTLPAHADVNIYGFISAGVESAKADGAAKPADNYKRTTRVTDENSRIGFKGSEDLGGGLKAVWQLEQSLRNFENGGVNDKGESATFATRNSFVGLSDAAAGTFVLGNYDSAYKRLTDVGLNVMSNTTADTHGSSSTYSRGETRLKNSVSWTSPNWAGFIAGFSYGFDEDRYVSTAATGEQRQNNDRWSLAGQYSNGGLKVGAGYDRAGDKFSSKEIKDKNGVVTGIDYTPNIDKTQFYKLAAAYSFTTGTTIGAGYEWGRVDYVGSKPDTKQNDWHLAVVQKFGAASVRASYGKLGKLDGDANADDFKASQWVLGATYDLTKQTQVFAYATKIKNSSAQNANFSVNPIYTSGQGSSKASLAKGTDPQAFGAGLRVNF